LLAGALPPCARARKAPDDLPETAEQRSGAAEKGGMRRMI
jgi:hypothetical protein